MILRRGTISSPVSYLSANNKPIVGEFSFIRYLLSAHETVSRPQGPCGADSRRVPCTVGSAGPGAACPPCSQSPHADLGDHFGHRYSQMPASLLPGACRTHHLEVRASPRGSWREAAGAKAGRWGAYGRVNLGSPRLFEVRAGHPLALSGASGYLLGDGVCPPCL